MNKNPLVAAVEQLLDRVGHVFKRHPRQVTAFIAAALLGGGGGAFAVASLGPDPADLPVAEVVQEVEPLPLQEQSQALDVHSFTLFRTEVTRSTDTADSLLSRLGLNDPTAADFLRKDPTVRGQLLGRPGRNVTAEASQDHALVRLTARWGSEDRSRFKRLVVERDVNGQLSSRLETGTLTPSVRLGSGTLQTTLFAAVDDAGIPDAVTYQLVDIFSGDIDFHRGIRRGDRFSVVYETLEADGESLRTGRVLSAEFVSAGRTHHAMWFQEPGKKGSYYNLDGQSLERAYLASPMAVSRVTSTFKMRFHPILQTWRAHLGTDYGAPTGTPVRTVGSGRVSFAGVQGGYGKVVIVDHGRGESSVYAHLSRIGVRRGQSVERGERVGAVGATGWATGPHLHFEFRQNGAQKNWLTSARRTEGQPLAAAARPAFDAQARLMRLQLAAAASTAAVVASAE